MKLRHYLFPLFFLTLSVQSTRAENTPPPVPLPPGVIASDWTLTDINGNTHTLYDYLDAGINVILDFGATWCGPCWNYHQTHILEDIYNAGEAMVFMIEADPSTPASCITGNCANTIGDWTAGTSYPIINLEGSGTSVAGDYAISYYPTVYGIAAYNKKVYEVGQASRATWQTWLLQSFELKETAAPIISDISCFGENSGAVDATITGGYVSKSYRWSNNRTTPDISNLAAGDYFLTVTEGNGHSIELGPYTVGGPTSPLIADVETIIPLECSDLPTGALVVNGSGGTPGYNYSWSNGASGPSVSGLSGGNYTVTVTDANGCTSTNLFFVPAPPSLELAVSTIDETCDGANGSILMLGFGGTPGYTYDIGFGPSPAEEYNNLSAGVYQVTITDTNGCTTMEQAVIENSPSPVADGGGDTDIPCDQTEVTLDGSSSSSGTSFITVWTSSDGNIVSGDSTLTPLVDTAGTYVLQITNNNNGCMSTDTILVEETADRPIADAGVDTTLTCSNISIRLDGADSSTDTLSTFTYQWSGPAGHILEGDSTLTPLVDTIGDYILEVTNTANGCISVDTVRLGGDFETPSALAGEDGEITCLLSDLELDGSASSNDTANTFQYQWSTGNGNIVGSDSSNMVNVDAPGTYVLEVINANNGCIANDTVLVNDNSQEPGADAGPEYSLDCVNTIVALSGSSSSNSGNLSFNWISPDGNIVSGANTPNPNIDQPGTYILEVVNGENGCSSTALVNISQDIEAPDANAGVTAQLDCNNSQLTLDGSQSSTGNVSYLWSSNNGNIISGENTLTPIIDQAGTYNLEVTNLDNGCTANSAVDITQDLEVPVADAGVSGQLDCSTSQITLDGSQSSTGNYAYLWTSTNGNIISGENTLTPIIDQSGTYILEVTNLDNGCSSMSSIDVNQDTQVPIASASITSQLDCNNTQVMIDGSQSSAGNFSYLWTSTNGNIISGANTLSPIVDQAGVYNLEVINNDNGCSTTTAINISQDIEYPIADAGATSQIDCNNNQITLDGSQSSTGNFSYLWSSTNGNIISGANTLTPIIDQGGTYTLEVINTNNGCTSTSTVNVNQDFEAPIADAGTSSQLDCNTSQITLDGSQSSTGNFSYLWTSANGNIISGANTLAPIIDQAGNYNLEVTNLSNGCISNSSININQNIELPAVSIPSAQELNCIVLEVQLNANASGNGPLSYSWSTSSGNIISGANTATPLVGSSGTYNLEVQNTSNNCITTSSIVVEEAPELEISLSATTDNLCNGESAGTAMIQVNGGTGNYFFNWSNGNTSAIANNLAAGIYTVEVSDEGGCSETLTFNITEPSLLLADANSTDETANGANDGSATVVVSGGVAPFNYSWSNGANTSSISNLAPDTYTVIITDANGCITEAIVSVSSFNCGLGGAAIATNVTCFGASDGSASVNIAGGEGPFNYQWSNGQQSGTINNLSPGNYIVTVTDANNCPFTTNVVIEQPDAINISVVQQSDVSCFGEANGSIALEAIGGTGNLNFQWSNGNNTNNAGNLTAGTYSILVEDENGCTNSIDIQINQPTELLVTTNSNNESALGANDGTASVSPNGGTAPYVYLWSNGATTSSITGLSPGTYIVEVSDALGCVQTETINIQSFDCSSFTAIIESVGVSCFGASDGSAIPSINGGINPFDFEWSTGSTANTLNNLSAGTYTLTITDSGNCPSIISFTIESPSPIGIETEETQDIDCFGSNTGFINLTANGGTGNLNYSWSNGSTGNQLNNLSAGIYNVVITDDNGCMISNSYELTQATPIEVTLVSQENVQCPDDQNGTATIDVEGGNGPYTYLWSNGTTGVSSNQLNAGIHQVLITDANQCTQEFEVNISAVDNTDPIVVAQDIEIELDENGNASISAAQIDNGSFDNCDLGDILIDQSTFDCSQLGPQTITLTVYDQTGNSGTATATVNVLDKLAPELISCPADIQAVNCDGMVSYALPTAMDNCQVSDAVLIGGLGSGAVFPMGTTEEIYRFTDNAGNEVVCSFMVTLSNTLEAGLVSAEEVCFGQSDGEISISATGGTPGYQYLWSDGQTTATASGLSAGVYTFTITDATGCEFTEVVTLTEAPELILDIVEVVNETGSNNSGSIDINVSGGTPPYDYFWSNGNTFISNDEDLFDIPAGEYQVEIVDSKGCVISSTTIIVENLTSTIDRELEQKIQIFPNPTRGRLFIQFEGSLNGDAQIELFDALGHQLQFGELAITNGAGYQLDLKTYPAGLYWIRVYVDNRMMSKKIVLNH